MARSLLAGGSLVTCMGAAMLLPVGQARLETGTTSPVGIGVAVAGCCMALLGTVAVVSGFRKRSSLMPAGVRAAAMANAMVLAFFALEFSDRLVRQEGRIFYWSTFLLLPAFVLFCGLVAARRWAWWAARSAAAGATLWFLGFVFLIPFADLKTHGVPVPWYGRAYMICVSLVFGAIMGGAFRSLGRPDARSYFGLISRTSPRPA